ncbi:MAG: BTAD domain-containing putative transcriptional regulator [Caldilineaceae bacterium]
MAHLDLTFLGVVQARLAGKSLVDLHAGRVQNLFVYLVIEAGQPHARSALASLFWPDEPEAVAKQSLRQTIYQLRQQLDDALRAEPQLQPFLLVERDTVQFNPASDYTLDVAAFQRHLKEQQWAQAAQLYQGDLLSGLSSNSERFEEWLLLRREQLHIQALDALDQLTQQALQTSDFAQAQHYARRQLALEPWRETAHRQLMLALIRNGERASALAQYESCRRLLAEELGAEPDGETEALVAQIRTGSENRVMPTTSRALQDDKVTISPPAVAQPPSHLVTPSPPRFITDWGEAPEVIRFQGREQELAELERWLRREARLVSVLGMGGMGKTSLAVKLCQRIAGEFEFVIWRSLLNAPPLGEILQGWQQILSGQQGPTWPDGLDAQLSLIFAHLRQKRCLLVLDNVESIMQAGRSELDFSANGSAARAGYFRTGYEAYEQLLKRLGETAHQSCLLLTSREQPQILARLERASSWVRSLPLSGLSSVDGRTLLQRQGVRSDHNHSEQLIERYSGNPLALMLVAETIEDLFDGDVAAFLQEDAPIFDDIRDMLVQQFARLAPLEQEILRWLAIEREPLSAQQLGDNFVQPVAKHLLLEALTSLRRRSLIEKSGQQQPRELRSAEGGPALEGGGFTLQNVVTEYITDAIIDQVCEELEQRRPQLLKSHALLKAQTREYVRQSQERLLLHPIIVRLRAKWGQPGLSTLLHQGLEILRQQPDQKNNYGAGNLLNLLIHAAANLRQLDLSHLALWQVHLKGVSLPAVNLANSELRDCVFTDSFGSILALDFSADGQQLAAGSNVGQIHLWQVSDGQSLGRVTAHRSFIFSVFFTPDQQALVSGGDDQMIHFWNLHEQQEQITLRQTLRGHSQGVWRLAVSRRGELLASVSGDRTLCLWNIQTGQLLHTLWGYKSGFRALAISSDGSLVATGDEGGYIRIWRTQSGDLVAGFKGHTEGIWSLAFHPFEPWLASGSRDHTACIWRLDDLLGVATWQNTQLEDRNRIPLLPAWRTLTGHTHFVAAVAFSPDGTLLASGSVDYSVRVWDVAEGITRYTLVGHSDDVNCVAFSPDGAILASGSNDRTVRLWDAQRGYALRTFQGHLQGIMAVTLSPTRPQLAAACTDHTVQLWSMGEPSLSQQTGDSSEPKWNTPLILAGHHKEVHSVAFSPDGMLVASGGIDPVIHLWESQSGKLRLVLQGHQGWVRLLHFTPDGNHLISCSNDWTIRLWDVRSGECLKTVKATESVWSFAVVPNQPATGNQQLLVSAGTSGTARLMDLLTGETIYILHGHTNWVVSLAISPDGSLLATGSADQTVRIWDLASGELRHCLTGHHAWVYALAFAPEKQGDTLFLASGSADQTICLWNARSGALLRSLHGHADEVRSVAFVPHNHPLAKMYGTGSGLGPLLLSGSTDETIRIWEVDSGVCLQILRAPRPYEGMNIANVSGLTDSQKHSLKALGAVET